MSVIYTGKEDWMECKANYSKTYSAALLRGFLIRGCQFRVERTKTINRALLIAWVSSWHEESSEIRRAPDSSMSAIYGDGALLMCTCLGFLIYYFTSKLLIVQYILHFFAVGLRCVHR